MPSVTITKAHAAFALFTAVAVGITLHFTGGGEYLATNVFEDTTMTQTTTATINTNYGEITIALYDDKAPGIVENFVSLATDGRYDNTPFHRVIEGFMIQGGDYEFGNGTGGDSYKGGSIPDEIHPDLTHTRGSVSMANRGPDTNGSQFFIVHQDSTFLDGRHSIFGQVVDGMDVVDKIAEVRTDVSDRPVRPVTIETIRIKE